MFLLLAAIGILQGPQGLIGHVAVRIGDKAVIAGGWSDAEHKNNAVTCAYSLKDKSWRQMAPMPSPRAFGAAIGWKGRLYFLGGVEDGGKHSDRIDVYDLQKNAWSKFGKLPEPMSRHAAWVEDGKAFVSGGYNGGDDRQASNSGVLFELDLATQKLIRLPAMPTPRHGHCLVKHQGRFWAIGGAGNDVSSQSPVESFDPKTKEWRREHPLPDDRVFLGADVFADKLVVFGSIKGAKKSLEWTPKGWRPRSQPDLSRRRFAFVRYEDHLVIFGGEPGVPFVTPYRP